MGTKNFRKMKYETEKRYAGNGRQNPMLHCLKDELLKGIEVIAALDDPSFRRITNETGSIGAQFRHNLDFVISLLNGLDEGRIDYSKRERNASVEEDRGFAIDSFRIAIRRLVELSERQLSKSVLVRSEVDPAIWLPSGFLREIEFVYSHTVHHHALISEKLAGFGFKVAANFGVAPSTIEYWDRKAAGSG